MKNNSKRITFITAAKKPWGAEHSLALLAKQLETKSNVKVICSTKHTFDFLTEQGLSQVEKIPEHSNRILTLFEFFRILRNEKRNTSVVVFSLQLSPIAFLLRFFSRNKLVTVLDIHDVPKSRFDLWATRISAKFFNRIIAISEYVRDSLDIQRPTTVIPRPIVPGLAVLKQGTRTGVNIGIVGRVDPEKRHDVAIRAVSKLSSDVSLLIFGDTLLAGDTYAQEIRSLADTTIPGRYSFEGTKPVHEVYENIDFLFVGNENEPSGRTVGEAMTRGILPIVPDSGGSKEYLPAELDWLSYDSLDADSAATLINKVMNIDDKVLTEMSKIAKTWIDEQNNPNKIASKYSDALK